MRDKTHKRFPGLEQALSKIDGGGRKVAARAGLPETVFSLIRTGDRQVSDVEKLAIAAATGYDQAFLFASADAFELAVTKALVTQHAQTVRKSIGIYPGAAEQVAAARALEALAARWSGNQLVTLTPIEAELGRLVLALEVETNQPRKAALEERIAILLSRTLRGETDLPDSATGRLTVGGLYPGQ